MPFDNSTDRARKIVELATEETTRLGDTTVNTVHLLLGMVREGEGVAGVTLTQHDIDYETLLNAYKRVHSEPDATLDEVESRCLFEVKCLGHHYIGTEHLLLSICNLKNSKATKLLTHLGKPPIELCQYVIELLGHDWNHWLIDHPDLPTGG